MIAKVLFVTLLATACAAYQRKLTAHLNPFCGDKEVCGLCYVTAEGSNDTLHYFWSALGTPAALAIQTAPGTKLADISWESLRGHYLNQKTFAFDGPVLSSSAVVISKLFEYNDPENKAHLNTALKNGTHYIDQTKLLWKEIRGCTGNGSSLVTSTFVAYGTSSDKDEGFFLGNGTIQFTLEVQDNDGHDIQFPHLLYTSNSSQIQLSLLNLSPQLGKTSQFGFELTILDDSSHNGSYGVSSIRTFDDEYTPGVFTNVALFDKNASSTFYLHWKPVCYRDPGRTVTLSVDAAYQNLTYSASWWNFNVATAWLSNRAPNVASSAVTVTFGSEGDGWYQENSYATWAMSSGFGVRPLERISATVLSVTSVGLGIPGIIALGTVIYVSVHKPEPKL
ncbi:glycosylated lysosomal membrane protein B [Rhipicephalus microplus]|uniref:Putative lysosomal protein ncu-g1-b n=2 Tax=Rhipicephalus microplus TaxID=6941 RepID=A0A6M2CJ18_RHIMP